jgi:biotin carboxylase
LTDRNAPPARARLGSGATATHAEHGVTSNLFLIGLDDFNRPELASIRGAEDIRFRKLLDRDEAVRPRNGALDFERMRRDAERRLAGFDGSVDGIAAFWDFPSSALAGVLRNAHGLPGPTDEAICRCEHKWWSRLEQQAVVPDLVPPFDALDPFAEDPLEGFALDYPFWIKPVKAHSSHLGFRIADAEDLRAHLPLIRERIDLFGHPFDQYLAHVDLPGRIRPVGGRWCIAEGLISAGRQCTLEGYVHQGRTVIYGVVDSIRAGRHRSCFARYQYPSSLPARVQARMGEAAAEVMARFGYDGAPFNMEFYWDPGHDSIRLLEVNARISKSHSPMFRMVDGASNQQVMADLALGRAPDMPRREGRFRVAAKFMVRVFRDGVVSRLPGPDDIARAHEIAPEARIHPLTERGVQLRHLPYQDSYSFELADIFLGADSQKELLARHARIMEVLPFETAPLREVA